MATPFPNQPPPYEGRNLYLTDLALRAAIAREELDWAEGDLTQWGAMLGSAEAFALADTANRNPPALRTYDRQGERIDEVEFDPAWHALMQMACKTGEHCLPWIDVRRGAQTARAAFYYLHAQVENGTQCPLTMTYASVPVLERHRASSPFIRDVLLPRVLARDYDPRSLPAAEKRAALIGMGMNERQGGSDVRANRTRAEPAGDGTFLITGHKWFFSAPQCDAHLVLAQSAEGLGCFLLPRRRDYGRLNATRLLRLKDKLGNRSNASSEVEFDGALAYPLGDPARGIATILEMVQHTRLDCVVGSAGIMRGCVAWALHHAAHRVAFGHRLTEQPLMQNVLADLALESEAALLLAMRLARAFDAPDDPAEAAFARIATPAAKFWVCKRAPAVAFEAMEVLGGNGYVEEQPIPRFYREAPVNSIWEGSGNVMCLDVLRACRREPAATEALMAELEGARGANAHLDRHVDGLANVFRARDDDPSAGRRMTHAIAVALQAALMARHSPAYASDAFCASRLAMDSGATTFGELPDRDLARRVTERASA
jgi:putative acyl-CoA dehydrogenase